MLQKETNPKEAAGSTRLPLHLIPDGPLAKVSLAFYEGAVKYTAYNWRVAGVRASTYVAAARRHLGKWWNGDDTDPVSRVHHLANATACLMIIMDAEIQGMLNDDRPTKQDLQSLYEGLAATQKHIYDTLAPKEANAGTLQEPQPNGSGNIEGAFPRYCDCRSGNTFCNCKD